MKWACDGPKCSSPLTAAVRVNELWQDYFPSSFGALEPRRSGKILLNSMFCVFATLQECWLFFMR